MAAFWEGYDNAQSARDRTDQAQMQQAQGLMQLMQAKTQMGQQQGLAALMQSDMPMEQKLAQLPRFGAPGLAAAKSLMDIQTMQGAMQDKQRGRDFWKDEAPTFTTPAQPARAFNDTPTGGMMGFQSGAAEDAGPQGMIPGTPAGTNLRGLLEAGARRGVIDPMALVKHEETIAEKTASRVTRSEELVQRLQQQEREYAKEREARAERQQEGFAQQRAMAQFGVANRQPERVTPYSDIGRIRQDVANGIISSDEGNKALADLQSRKTFTLDRTSFDKGAKLRAEYERNPEVKAANAMEATFNPIMNYMESLRTNPKGFNDTEDMRVLKAYLAATHPKGDQINNMDRKELAKLGSLDERFSNGIESFFRGKNLPDNVRSGMVNVIGSKFSVYDGQRKASRSEKLKIGKDGGVPSYLIFADAPE